MVLLLEDRLQDFTQVILLRLYYKTLRLDDPTYYQRGPFIGTKGISFYYLHHYTLSLRNLLYNSSLLYITSHSSHDGKKNVYLTRGLQREAALAEWKHSGPY